METIKNLVLAGISIDIFDGSAVVTEADLEHNFFVVRDQLGENVKFFSEQINYDSCIFHRD